MVFPNKKPYILSISEKQNNDAIKDDIAFVIGMIGFVGIGIITFVIRKLLS